MQINTEKWELRGKKKCVPSQLQGGWAWPRGICSVPALGCQHRSGFPAGPAALPPAPSRAQFHMEAVPDLCGTAKGKGKKEEKRG